MRPINKAENLVKDYTQMPMRMPTRNGDAPANGLLG